MVRVRKNLLLAGLVTSGCLASVGCVVAPPRAHVAVVARPAVGMAVVAPARVWVPAHWSRDGRWIPGHWRVQ